MNGYQESRRVFPDAPILLGGNVVSCMPEKVLRTLQADFGVLGEGEASVVELVTALESGVDPLQVPGLAVRKKATGEVIITKTRYGMKNLDELPFPDYEGFDFDECLNLTPPNADVYYGWSVIDKPRTMNLLASRSCPYGCTFCYHTPGEKYRQRSVENCFAEVDYTIERYGINSVRVHDEIFFTASKMKRLRSFCQHFAIRDLTWTCAASVRDVTRETLELLKDSGCIRLTLGIEQVSDKILKSMRKNITREQIENALELAYEVGICVGGNLLFGDPEETLDSFYETAEWWLRNQKYVLNLNPIYTLPNSPLYLRARECGLIRDEIKYIEESVQGHVINLTRMSQDEFAEMLRRIRELSGSVQFMGFLLELENAGEDSYARARYNLLVRCPHCGYRNSYREIFFPNEKELQFWDPYYFLYCRECRRVFNIFNPVSWCEEPLPRRQFLSQYPVWKLLNLYFERGGSLAELAHTEKL